MPCVIAAEYFYCSVEHYTDIFIWFQYQMHTGNICENIKILCMHHLYICTCESACTWFSSDTGLYFKLLLLLILCHQITTRVYNSVPYTLVPIYYHVFNMLFSDIPAYLQYQNQVLFLQRCQTLFTRRLLSITVGYYVDAKSLSLCVCVWVGGTQVLM